MKELNIQPLIYGKMIAHAKKEKPNESCGLVQIFKGKQRYRECGNVAQNPHHDFLIDPKEYAQHEDQGSIIAIVHSHVLGSTDLSEADRLMCNQTNVPWIIVNPDTNLCEIHYPQENYHFPLEGREFHHGVIDCFTLVFDYYHQIGIQLKNMNREDEWWNIEPENNPNYYVKYFKEQGFFEIEMKDLRKHDGILMTLESKYGIPNHSAVYLGDNRIMHHVYDRLSGVDMYGGYYQKMSTHFLRHESLK